MNQDTSPLQPPQEQAHQPGRQGPMDPPPVSMRPDYSGSGKLQGRVALVTGGDSGIGRAVAQHFAREGADVAVAYLEETQDAKATQAWVEAEGRRCLLIPGDLGSDAACHAAVAAVIDAFGRLDVLVNNLAEQHPVDDPANLDREQVEKTFRTNVFSFYSLITAALPHLKDKASIINTGSITGSRGHETLLDYAGTKGAIHAMTMSFAQALADRGIRVNAVAPGPIWTPLIPASFDAEKVARFGSDTLMKRAGQPSEVAPAFVYLASEDASFVTGQILHVNGGGYLSA